MIKYTGLIPASLAAIHWRTDPDDVNKIIDIDVSKWDWEEYSKEEMYCISRKYDERFNCSSGRFMSGWENQTPQSQLAECWEIVLDSANTTTSVIKKYIFEIGKIKEFEKLRMVYFRVYMRDCAYFYEDFLEEYYLVPKPDEKN